MNRNTLARSRFQRTSPEGGGGGTGGDNQQTGDNGQQQNTGPEMAKDDDGNDLFPKNTAVAEMSPEHRANYWRTEAKKQQRLREDAERKNQSSGGQNNPGSGTVPNQQQTQGAQSDDAAVQARIDAARREGQRDAVVVSMTASLQMRGKKTEEITEILDVVNPDKFLDDGGKVDTTKVANFLSRVAPAGSNGGGGAPGQGRLGEGNQRTDPREIAREEAKRRGFLDPGADRGALGGLRK